MRWKNAQDRDRYFQRMTQMVNLKNSGQDPFADRLAGSRRDRLVRARKSQGNQCPWARRQNGIRHPRGVAVGHECSVVQG